eukprot:2861569-Rhodomonas_salina.2
MSRSAIRSSPFCCAIPSEVSIGPRASKAMPGTDWRIAHALAGNSKTAMIAAVSPHFSAQARRSLASGDNSAGETLSTLKFASFAKLSQLVAKRNVCNHDLSLAELKLEVRRLKQVLASKQSLASDQPCEVFCVRFLALAQAVSTPSLSLDSPT